MNIIKKIVTDPTIIRMLRGRIHMISANASAGTLLSVLDSDGDYEVCVTIRGDNEMIIEERDRRPRDDRPYIEQYQTAGTRTGRIPSKKPGKSTGTRRKSLKKQ